MNRGYSTVAVPRKDALGSVLSLQQGSDLVVGVQPEGFNEEQLIDELDPDALQTELHALVEANKGRKSGIPMFIPLIEAVGLLLHVRGAHAGHHLGNRGLMAGSNYNHTVVQLCSYFEEAMVSLANVRVAELIDSEADELSMRLADHKFMPEPAQSWPALTKLAKYLQVRVGHIANLRGLGADPLPPKHQAGDKQSRKFQVVLKWSGGMTMGKTTELTVLPSDSIYDLKRILCAEEPSLCLPAVRLSVMGTPIGFHAYGATYDVGVDKGITVASAGLVPGMAIDLTTATTASGSLGY